MPRLSLLLALTFVSAPAMEAGDIVKARDYCYRQQYDSAQAVTARQIARDSTDPAGFCWHASVLQLRIYDSGLGWLADSFLRTSDRAVALCRRRLVIDPGDGVAHFYYGMTQLNRASFLGWQQKTMPAFNALFEVTPHLNAALADDPGLKDARLGLGMVEYFKASSDRYLLGLTLFGSREKAYQAVRSVADGDGLLAPAAEMMLAYMLKEDCRCDSAVAYCRRLLASYPGNRTAKRLMRDAYFKAGRFDLAVQVGAEIDSALAQTFTDNKYAQAENWTVCGKAYARLGQKAEARARFAKVLAWERHQKQVPWLASYVREAKQWQKKLGE